MSIICLRERRQIKWAEEVLEFENAAVFEGKTFWQVEQEIEWVDC